MSLDIFYSNSRDHHFKQVWHVKNRLQLECGMVDITYIAASGQELEFIINNFNNLPYKTGFCRWYGDLARFIVGNILNMADSKES
jgi:hypothetical protein